MESVNEQEVKTDPAATRIELKKKKNRHSCAVHLLGKGGHE